MGHHHGQEAGHKFGFDSSKDKDLRLRIVTVPGVQEEARRKGVETEKNKDRSSSCDIYVTRDDVRCFLQIVFELNGCCSIAISQVEVIVRKR